MSRALDKHVIAALKHGDHEKIFHDITGIFLQQEDERLLEIEILGRSHPVGPDENFLRDDNAVAIPKLRLVQAFLVARQVLQRNVADGSGEASELRSATSALLLMDPEHLTAANTRKRLLLRELSTGVDARPHLMREKWFVDSLLTSRLHRHTKSPTLWSHRRWLLEKFRDAGVLIAVQRDIEAIIMVAGERHPRNYYAWAHARWLTKDFQAAHGHRESLLLIQSVKKWSFQHHTDISGWSFLARLLEIQGEGGIETSISVFMETLKLVEYFSWGNDSVWWFLRTVASSTALGHTEREEFVRVQAKLSAVNAEGSAELKVLQTAKEWYDLNNPCGDGVVHAHGTKAECRTEV